MRIKNANYSLRLCSGANIRRAKYAFVVGREGKGAKLIYEGIKKEESVSVCSYKRGGGRKRTGR